MDSESIAQLLRPEAYRHSVEAPRLMETHASWVLLTGEYAYKIKKPHDFGFLDYSTLAKRQHFCGEEIRLNRRFAPQVYLDVVPVTRDAGCCAIEGQGEVVDYAVKMRQFSQDALLDHELQAGRFAQGEAAQLGQRIAELHRQLPAVVSAKPGEPGSPQSLHAAMVQNFEQIAPYLEAGAGDPCLARVENWTLARYGALEAMLAERVAAGRVRECHGDLHLGNIAHIDGRYLPFDCIEFNDNFRLFDVQGEIAFLAMDLERRGRLDEANRLYNAYLETGGDYDGVPLTRLYRCYFAVVRAKVALFGATPPLPDDDAIWPVYHEYMALAETYCRPSRPALLLMHGASGAGKSTVAEALMPLLDGIRLRADVERKRLFGLDPLADSGSSHGGGIYTEEASERTYAQLAATAATLLAAGHSCIIDATFLAARRRAQFLDLADSLQLPAWIVSCRVPEAVLRQRVAARQGRSDDASEADLAVLESQLTGSEALSAEERHRCIELDCGASDWRERLSRELAQRNLLPLG